MAPQLDDDLNLDKQGLKSTLLWALLETERGSVPTGWNRLMFL